MPTLSAAEIASIRAEIVATMTASAEHRNNPTGAAATSSVATGIPITPINSIANASAQDYPTEKAYLMRHCFTAYTAFRSGDFLISGGVTYVVQAVHASQTSLNTFYYLILEQQLKDT
jgi:hypothetical protein